MCIRDRVKLYIMPKKEDESSEEKDTDEKESRRDKRAKEKDTEK